MAKAISWRVAGAVATSAIVFAFTRRLALSLYVGGLEFILKIGLFWVHERAWDKFSFGRTEARPSVIWFTGVSGSGKSTISQRVTDALRAKGLKVEHLDGDTIRSIFPNTGFTRPDRDSHVRRIGFLASKLEEHGVFVVASFVSPYRESRDFVRNICQNFVEVYVSTPLEECERRDVKGLYAKARRGEVASFTGISDPYEAPVRPELVIDTTDTQLDAAVSQVLEVVQRRMSGRIS
ncbi:MAG: adenylyl-sulfate kinase [Gemmatimonadaceae bacterium]